MYDSYRTSKKESISEIKHLISKSTRIGNNTFEIIYKDGTKAIRLHYTDVVIFDTDYVILSAGNWLTHTTKSRINQYIPCGRVAQENHIWYVCGSNGKFLFYNGIKVDYNGYILSPLGKILEENESCIT